MLMAAPAVARAQAQGEHHGVCRNSFGDCLLEDLTDCTDFVDCFGEAVEAALFAVALAILVSLALELALPALAFGAIEAIEGSEIVAAADAASVAAAEAAAAADAAAAAAVAANTATAGVAAAEASQAAAAAAAAAEAASAAAAAGEPSAVLAAAAEAEAAAATAGEAAEAAAAEQAESAGLRTVLSGHGGFDAANGYVTVPPGTSVTMFTGEGGGILDSVGGVVDQGFMPQAGDVPGVQTFYPGDQIPNYTLYPPGSLNILGNPSVIQSGAGAVMGQANTVNAATNLAQLLAENQGEVWWSACRTILAGS